MIEVLDRIPVTLEADGVMQWLRIRDRGESVESMVRELIETSRAVARPKAVYAVAGVDNLGQDSLDIDGIRFTSRILRINLDKANRVFPYVATCGQEMEEIPLPDDDLLRAYCLDVIKTLVLVGAVAHLASYLTRRYQLGKMSHMNPGSLESWPITQQTELFSVLGDVDDAIGVTLTEGMTMVPLKSASGIYFPAENEFENCQLCPMEKCIGRRAPYDPDLVKQYEETSLVDP
jgi:hypothetical protein